MVELCFTSSFHFAWHLLVLRCLFVCDAWMVLYLWVPRHCDWHVCQLQGCQDARIQEEGSHESC